MSLCVKNALFGRCERDLLREELEGAAGRIQKLSVEVSELEATSQDQATRAAHDAASLEEVITQERARRTESEAELRQIQEVRVCLYVYRCNAIKYK